MQIEVTIDGLDELRRKLDGGKILQDPVTRALEQSAIAVENSAKKLVPVDMGRLRASISHRVDPSPIPRFAEVGTNVKYAPFVHEGRRAGAKMPPPAALETWAARHGGMDPFVLARAIAIRGIKPRRFLADALEQEKSRIDSFIRQVAKEIEDAWAR